MGHRVTKLGHVCDPIVSSITSVTLVHGSQGHAGHMGHVVFLGENFVSGSQSHVDHGVCFWYILFLGHMVTLVTLCFCNIVSGSQSHAGHVGNVVFF